MAGNIAAGQRISQLVIRNVLNKGGMATIVRAAYMDGVEHEVALKIAKPDPPGDPFYGLMLQNEVEVMRRLSLPGVVRILPMTWERRPNVFVATAIELVRSPWYYAMELLAGPSLEQHLKAVRTLSPGEAAAVGAGVAETLSEVHGEGYAHNDIKVDNIVFRRPLTVGASFEPVLVDFGVAVKHKNKVFDGLAPPFAAPEKLQVAAEQKAPEFIDDLTKTDIWSLGVTLYQALTGRLPYEGSTAASVLTSIRRRKPAPISERQPDIPRELEEWVVRRCLASKPADRPTAQELARGLARHASRSGVEKVGRTGWFR